MAKSNLEIAIDWIYAHVRPEARSLLQCDIGPQKAAYGAEVYVSYTAVFFKYQGLEFSTRASILAETPRQAEYVLLDMRRELGIPITFEYYEASGVPPEMMVDPVGDEWKEKTAEVGRTCYRISQSLTSIYEGMPWESKSKGLVTAMAGSSWFGLKTIWWWVKA